MTNQTNAPTNIAKQPKKMAAAQRSKKLHELADKKRKAKSAVDQWNVELDFVNQQIIDLVGLKHEGSTTLKTSQFKFTTVGRLNRNISDDDATALHEMLGSDFIKRLLKFKPSVVVSELKFLRENEPELYNRITNHITTTPGKPAVEVSEIKK